MRRKLALLMMAVLMLAMTGLRDTGGIGRAQAVARADGYCIYVDPIPPWWQGGYICIPLP